MIRQTLACCVITLLLSPAVSADTLLATFAHSGVGSVSTAGGDPSWVATIGFSAPNDPPTGTLQSIVMTLIDVAQGNSYELTGNFAEFESLSIDGISQSAYIGFTVPNGGTGDVDATTEQALIAAGFGIAPGVGPEDFAGFDLTRVVVMPTAFQFGGGGSFSVTNEFYIYGDPVPEPMTSALAAIALGACAFARRVGR